MVVREARKKLATSISKIEVNDEFQFNKWLRPPINKKIEIPKVRTFEDPQLIDFEKLRAPLAVKLKFNFTQPDVPEIKFPAMNQKVRSYMVFFSIPKQKIFDKSDVFVCRKIPEISNQEFLLSTTVINKSKIYIPEIPKIFEKSFRLVSTPTRELPMLISHPVIKDYIAEMIPEIIKIDLLESDSVVFELNQNELWHKFEIDKIKTPKIYKIKVPGIENIFNYVTSTKVIPIIDLKVTPIYDFKTSIDSIPKISKTKFELTKSPTQKINFTQYDSKAEVVDILGSEHRRLADKVKQVLSPIIDLKWEDITDKLSFLKEYEIEGAKFLSEHNFAVLADELGIDKKSQLLTAAKFLIRSGLISSVLCLTQDTKLNDSALGRKFNKDLGWESTLLRKFPDLHYTIIDSQSDKITSSTHLTFIPTNKISSNSLDVFKQIKKFGLVIIDDLVANFPSKELLELIIDKVEPDYLWITSDIANESINETLISEFEFGSKVKFSYLGRTLEDVKSDSEIIREEVWLRLDEMQQFEYEEAVNAGIGELLKTIESMNPFKFQSNIFTLIHKLKQIHNFASFRNISPKSTILIEQLIAITRNRRKALIFTQYDENGLKKIDQMLSSSDLKFVTVKNGAPIEEIKNSVEDFYNKKEICALVTNLKPSKLNIDVNKVSYIINFDQWWNPVINWQNESELKLYDKLKNKVVVYDYFIMNTFEENLKYFLLTKGLLERDLFEFVKNEVIAEMIPQSEWLKFFGYKVNDDGQFSELNKELIEYIEHTDLSKFKEMVTLILGAIGYKELEITDIKQEPSFYVTGYAKKGRTKYELQAKGIMSDNVTLADYEEILTSQNNKNVKRLVFANCDIEKVNTGNITFVDKHQLANYTQLLGYVYKFLTKRASTEKLI